MKKILFLIMILAAISVFAGKYENELTERMKVAEEKAEAGWDTGVRSEMVNASLDLDSEWDKELNNVYNLILKKLPTKEKVKFKAEQQKWIKDRETKVQKRIRQI